MKNSITLLFAFLIVCNITSAHSRTEIGFKFIEEERNTYLEVHLTTLTLFDLLHDLYPALKSKESLNLSTYAIDYQDYFNEILDIELNGEDQNLVYVDSNLITHDATITFLIEDYRDPTTNFNIAINGFDFYQRPSYTVLFLTSEITDTYFLSRVDNTCSNIRIVSADQINWIQYWPYGMLAIGFVIIGIMSRRNAISYKVKAW